MTRPLGQDLNADVFLLCKKWKGINSEMLCKNCGEVNAHSAGFCRTPRILSLPCQLCYGLDLSSVPHSEMDCQGASEANKQLYIKLQHMLFLKRTNGTISPRAPAPAAASGHRAVGIGCPNAGLQEMIPSRMSRGPHNAGQRYQQSVLVPSRVISYLQRFVMSTMGCSRATLLAMQVAGNSDV